MSIGARWAQEQYLKSCGKRLSGYCQKNNFVTLLLNNRSGVPVHGVLYDTSDVI